MAKFEVSGTNLAKIAERARSRNVPLYRVELGEGRLTFRTKRVYVPTMIAILTNMCYHNCKNAGDSEKNVFWMTANYDLKFFASRAALFAFAAIFLFSCFWVNGRVLEIEINSDNDVLVQSLLDEYGIKQGQRVQNIKEVEHFLNRKLDARYVFVRQQGIKLSVEVWAKNGQPLELAERSIVAPCDGVVQSVILLSGTSLVKAGDTVKAGDVLIEGKIQSQEGTSLDCKAVGKIFLECEVTKNYEYETVRRSPYRTGRSASYTQMDFLFGKYGKFDNPFTDFETVERESVVNFMFPVVCRRVEVYELGYITETVDFEKIRDFVIAEKTAQALEESETPVLSSRAEVSGEETKTISIIMRTLIQCGG